jgi:hypothetical protein
VGKCQPTRIGRANFHPFPPVTSDFETAISKPIDRPHLKRRNNNGSNFQSMTYERHMKMVVPYKVYAFPYLTISKNNDFQTYECGAGINKCLSPRGNAPLSPRNDASCGSSNWYLPCKMTDSLQFGDARSNVSKKQGESNGHAQRIHNVIPVNVFMTRPPGGEALRFQRFGGTGDDYKHQPN